MKLVVAEKPSVAAALAEVLGAKNKSKGYIEGNGYIVTWCLGHLVGLAMPESYGEQYKTWSFDNLPIIPSAWHMGVAKDKASQYNVIKSLLNDSRVDEVVCATDTGREGECIFRYVYKLSRCNKPVKRLWVSSNEESEIRKGFANLKDDSEYDNLYSAGLCRAKADWLIGINASRVFSIRYNNALSVGRVQTPTLNMIVQRDKEIESFVKQKYFTVEIDCGGYKAVSDRIDNIEKAEEIVRKCNGKTAEITEVVKENKTASPPKLFSLSSLQTEVSKRFSYTAKQTLDIAQSLYDSDKRLTTYPRTNSEYLTDEMEQSTLNVISLTDSVFPGNKIDYEPNVKRCMNSKKVEDHHAIIPTAEIKNFNLSALKENELNVLRLVCERLLVATAPNHKYESTKVKVMCEGVEYKASGKVIIEDGFKAVERRLKGRVNDEDKEEDEKPLPNVSEGDKTAVTAEIKEHWTKPPLPYTDGTLIKAMKSVAKTGIISDENNTEIRGIGTEATRAGIIEELIGRKYIERQKSKIVSTQKGRNLISVVPEEVKSPQTTAEWETRFYDIEKGKDKDIAFLSDIESYVRKLIADYAQADSSLSFADEPVGECPRCHKKVYERKTFYSCESGKDGCGFGVNKEILKKTISTAQVKKLLSSGKTDLIKGFTSKSGKPFNAFLILKDGNVCFEMEKAVSNVIGICPRCGKEIIETPKAFSCCGGKDGGCGFTLWKEEKKRHIKVSAAQAAKLIEGKSVTLNAVSAEGKKYSAHFMLEDTGKYVNLKYIPKK